MKKKVFKFFLIVLASFCAWCSFSIGTTEEENWYDKYEAFLNIQNISKVIIWIDVTDGSIGTEQSYRYWSDEQKEDLKSAIHRLEVGDPYPMQNPPELIDDQGYINKKDAWTIYIAHIAHSIWVEINHLVAWSILEYSPESLMLLLNSSYMFLISDQGYKFDYEVMGNVTDWNVDISYHFMRTNGFIMDNPEGTVYAFADWVRTNVRHYYLMSSTETEAEANYRFWKYVGPPPVDRILYPVTYPNYYFTFSAGCWGTTGLFSAVMRSVNIPVRNETNV